MNKINDILLTEGRVDDAKRKYPEIPDDIFSDLATTDPSGNHKYLDWLAKHFWEGASGHIKQINDLDKKVWDSDLEEEERDKAKLLSYEIFEEQILPQLDYLYEVIHDYHKLKESQRLTTDKIYEIITINAKAIDRIRHILVRIIKNSNEFTGTNFTYKSAFSILKSNADKILNDINNYTPYTIDVLTNFVKKNYPTKKEVRKKMDNESDLIYEDRCLKIIVPKTHAASCHFGVGSKWCTASKNNPSHFRSYTSGTNKGLIYFIFKKDFYSGYSNSPQKMALFWKEEGGVYKYIWFDAADTLINGGNFLWNYLISCNEIDYRYNRPASRFKDRIKFTINNRQDNKRLNKHMNYIKSLIQNYIGMEENRTIGRKLLDLLGYQEKNFLK